MKMTKIYLLLSALFLCASCGDVVPREKQNYIPIYVTPFYESEPLGVNAGPYSERLMSNSRSQMLALSEEFKRDKDNIHIIPMAVLMVRLYDLGLKDEACYWYYTFQMRRNIVRSMLDNHWAEIGHPPFELTSAADSFKQLAGEWINGYSFGDPEKLFALIEQIIEENRDMGYIAQAYDSNTYRFKPEAAQQAYVDEQIEAMQGFITYLRENKDDILRQRRENGIEGKY